jgi:hypothetical protein
LVDCQGHHHPIQGVCNLSDHKHGEPKRPEAGAAPAAPSAEDRRQYVNFGFYKVDPAWRRLPVEDRQRG